MLRMLKKSSNNIQLKVVSKPLVQRLTYSLADIRWFKEYFSEIFENLRTLLTL